VHHVRLVGGEGTQRTDIGRPFRKDYVTRIDEDPGGQVERLLGADGDYHVIGMRVDALQFHHVTDLFPKADVTTSRAVLQRDGAVAGNQAACHVPHHI
jgi:hypothetical protein